MTAASVDVAATLGVAAAAAVAAVAALLEVVPVAPALAVRGPVKAAAVLVPAGPVAVGEARR
ncbi:MAG: hypothetical protein F4156_11795 [Holophagales bacterium]|nr:hypothetical protein [Holophagales bacterium]